MVASQEDSAHRKEERMGGKGREGIAGIVALAMALAGAGVTPTSAQAQAPLPSFGNPTISGIQGFGFEQDLRLDTHGRIYTSVPGSLGSNLS
ncbi:MAG TPA: hypothetical protein VJO72_07885, partial [Candidatus Dormibacteraeota bacterium]|nr:hypothetical protein [Candidatus Dormibacteraeota bacterium]